MTDPTICDVTVLAEHLVALPLLLEIRSFLAKSLRARFVWYSHHKASFRQQLLLAGDVSTVQRSIDLECDKQLPGPSLRAQDSTKDPPRYYVEKMCRFVRPNHAAPLLHQKGTGDFQDSTTYTRPVPKTRALPDESFHQ